VKWGEEVNGRGVSGQLSKQGEQIHSKEGIRRQRGIGVLGHAFVVRSLSSHRKNLVKLRLASCWRVKVMGFTEAILRYKVVFIPTCS